MTVTIDYDQWDERLGQQLAERIGTELGEQHWKVIRFLRADYPDLLKLNHEDFYEGVEDVISATDFVEKTDRAQLLFI